MKDDYTKVEITKKDLETKEILEGAKLQLLDSEGKVVAEFTSENKAYEMTKLPVGEYTLHEVKAPKGYNLAEDVKVVIEETGKVQEFSIYDVEKTNNVPISKQDITTGEEIKGAKLELLNSKGEVIESWISTDKPHVVNNLKAGTYKIRETKAPAGYLLAEEVEFTIDSEGNITGSTIMKDDYTKVDISKKDIVTKEELPGATLQVKDSNGNIIEEWVSSTEPHRINRLPMGDYILVEKQAPNGYLIAEEVKFTVTETGEIQKVEMFDAKKVSLYIKKDVSNIEKLNGNEEFTIKVSGEFADGTTEKYIKFAYDELGKEKPVIDVIYGNKYKISEPQHDGYTVKIDKESVILMESKELVTVINTLDIPDIPEKPDNPGTPEEPGKPDTPDTPGNPGEPEKPDNPGNPEEPEKPDTPDNPGSPEEPEQPDTPNNPGSPEGPEEPDTPGNPGNPEEPEKPDTPGNPGNPEEPEKPDTPDNPGQPDEPEEPDTPDNPESPEEPEEPDTPDNPGNPEEPEKPDTPNNPGSPEKPGQPDAPSNPNSPNNPIKSDDLKDGDDVQTGDSSLTNEVAIGAIALIALVVLWINDKRRRNL